MRHVQIRCSTILATSLPNFLFVMLLLISILRYKIKITYGIKAF